MEKILSPQQASEKSEELKKKGKKIVVAGGCFDILHMGHIEFLKAAKKEGILFIILESDESVKARKGEKRPINNQKARAKILSSLSFIDFVIPLNGVTTNDEYDTLMAEISPDIIATTQNDAGIEHKERQAKKYGGKIKFVIGRIGNISSTKFAQLLS